MDDPQISTFPLHEAAREGRGELARSTKAIIFTELRIFIVAAVESLLNVSADFLGPATL